jgi:hypothetical protein
VDGNGPELCQMAGFDIGLAKPSGSATRKTVNTSIFKSRTY